MQLKIGTSRIVLVMPGLGIVVKFARPHPLDALSWMIGPFKIKTPRRNKLWVLRHYLTLPPRARLGVQYSLFYGLAQNWYEFWFYHRTHNRFVIPTYFSLFGLINVQAYGALCEAEWRPFRVYMEKLVGSDDFYKSPHHLSEPKNFCVVDGKLRIFDYGSKQCREVIRKHETRLADEFDLSKCAEEKS